MDPSWTGAPFKVKAPSHAWLAIYRDGYYLMQLCLLSTLSLKLAFKTSSQNKEEDTHFFIYENYIINFINTQLDMYKA